MYLNYNIFKCFELLVECYIDHSMMWIITACSIILGFIIFINKNNKIINYIISIINILLIILILYFYHNSLLCNKTFIHFNHNIYFYFLNSIIYLIIISIYLYKYKSLIVIHYLICLIFISYSLFITMYLKNIHLIIIGNVYPMIVFGIYLYYIFYIYLIIKSIKKLLTKNH